MAFLVPPPRPGVPTQRNVPTATFRCCDIVGASPPWGGAGWQNVTGALAPKCNSRTKKTKIKAQSLSFEKRSHHTAAVGRLLVRHIYKIYY